MGKPGSSAILTQTGWNVFTTVKIKIPLVFLRFEKLKGASKGKGRKALTRNIVYIGYETSSRRWKGKVYRQAAGYPRNRSQRPREKFHEGTPTKLAEMSAKARSSDSGN